jgi:restriction endonuclease S subunit
MKVFNEKAIKLSESSKNIALIDFKDLVLNTEDTMKDLSDFIGINFEKILISPSINGQEIDNETYKIIGNINDDPNKYLSKNEMDVLMYSINGFNKKYSFFKNLVIFLKLLKWRLFPNTISLIKKLLSKVLSRRLYSLIRSYYKEKI